MSIFKRIGFKDWGNAPKEQQSIRNIPDDDLKWISSSNLALLALAHLIDAIQRDDALSDELRRRGSAERKPQEKPK